MGIKDDLKAQGIEVEDSDKILIAPDYAFIRRGGKRRAKAKADTVVENMIRGFAINTHDIHDAKLVLCEDLNAAESEIARIAALIHDGKHGVGIEYSRIASNLIQCKLWKD